MTGPFIIADAHGRHTRLIARLDETIKRLRAAGETPTGISLPEGWGYANEYRALLGLEVSYTKDGHPGVIVRART